MPRFWEMCVKCRSRYPAGTDCPKCPPVVRICDNCAFESEETHTPAVLDGDRTSWSVVHATPTKILRCHALPTIVEVPPGRPACVHFKARES